MDVRANPKHERFTGKVKQFQSDYAKIVKEAADQASEIHKKSIDLANCINALSRSFETIGKMNKKVQIPTQSKLFTKLSKIFAGQSLALQNTGELIKIYCAQAMKYYKQEHEPLIEVVHFRNQQHALYLTQEKALQSQKEGLFKKNIKNWGFDGEMMELIGREHDLTQDKRLAFHFMLTKETKKLHETKERVNFFTN